MTKRMVVLAVSTLILAPKFAVAEGTFAIAPRVGTPGIGVDLVIATPAPRVNVRAGVSLFEYKYDTTEDDIDYEFKLKLKSGLVVADLFPFGGGFRLSGGGFYNKNKIDGTAKPRGTYQIGDNTYPGALVGTLDGVIDFGTMVPYAGIGFGNPFGAAGRFTFTMDLGIAFQGEPHADLTASGPINLVPGFQDDLEREEASLNDDLKAYKYYPIFSLGLAYRF